MSEHPAPWLITFLAAANFAGPLVGFCMTWKAQPHDCTGTFTDAEKWAYVFIQLLYTFLAVSGWSLHARSRAGVP